MQNQNLQENCLSAKSFTMTVRIFLVLLLLASFHSLIAQKPASVLQAPPQTNFFEIQQQFNDTWKDQPVGKGSGYNIFRRWEWYWEQRVGSEGLFPTNDIIVREWKKYTAEHAGDVPLGVTGNWMSMGPSETEGGYAGLGRVNCIAFHPTDKNTFWVGTASGGVWKTTNYGQSWTTNYDQQPVLGVSDIVIDPRNPDTMYIATGDGDFGSLPAMNGTGNGDTQSIGVLKSVDAGQTWRPTGLSWNVDFLQQIRRLIMHPTNSAVLFAATSNGIYKTINGGNMFEKKATGYFTDIAINPGNASILYAATRSTYSAGTGYTWAQIYRSVDGGESWDTVTSLVGVGRIGLAVTPQQTHVVEAICTNQWDGLEGLYRSVNDGQRFVQFFDGMNDYCRGNMLNAYYTPGNGIYPPCKGQGYYDLCYVINPKRMNQRWLGGVNTWKSDPNVAGGEWLMMTYWKKSYDSIPAVHADKHWFTFHPLEDNTFFDGNDGGIYFTRDNGKNWTDISNGLQIGQLYRIGSSYTDPGMIMAGFQDNGSQIHQSSGKWLAPPYIGGDGMECLIDYDNADIQYATYCNGTIYRTKDAAWTKVDNIYENFPGGKPAGAWITPFLIHPDSAEILYAGYAEIYKTKNRGDDWDKISYLASTNPRKPSDTLLRTLVISESNPAIMYAARKFQLFKTTNEWIDYTVINHDSLPLNYCMLTGVAVHPKRPDTLYVTFSGYKAGKKVYRSYDAGANWVNISQGLPNLPVNCIVYQKDANDALYVGTDVGVYFRNAGMDQWQLYNTGLPNVVISELEIQYIKGKIRAATYGRGLWESDLYTATGTYQVNTVSLPKGGGSFSGAGTYQAGAQVKLNCYTKAGYRFEGWYENDAKVKDVANYDFEVNANRNLVAKFIRTTGVEDNLKGKVHIFPNPAKGIVEISLDKNLGEELTTIKITNMDGRSVYESTIPKTIGDRISIDLSANRPGSYLVSICFKSGKKVTCKLILSK